MLLQPRANIPALLLVFWSIGASFVVMSGLVFLPSRVVGALGVLLIVNAQPRRYDFVQPRCVWPAPTSGGAPFAAGVVVAARGRECLLSSYPLPPWLGAVAAGYGFGQVVRLEPARRWSMMLVPGPRIHHRVRCAASLGCSW